MNHPPRWAEKMISGLAPDHLADEISGDLYEMYFDDLTACGVRKANRRYVLRIFGFLLKNFFWRKRDQPNYKMTGNYFKMAKRSLAANKGTTIINILGLVIGIASSLVILSVIRFEESFDTFHSKKDGVYRLVRISGDENLEYRSGISYPVPEALKTDIARIRTIAAIDYFGASNVDVMSSDGKTLKKFSEDSGVGTVPQSFFEIFDFAGTPVKWIAGNREKALEEPYSVVITREIAKKYFGDDDPLDQTLRFQQRFNFKITGVIDDFPANTDFPFKFIMSSVTMKLLHGADRMADWVSVNDSHQVFVYAPDVAKEELEASIDKVHAAHVDKDLSSHRHYRLQDFKEVHYDSRYGNFSDRTITHETLLALKIIVLFLLLAGCINYINLSTAQSTLRSKEIGLRKVMGSSQRSLVLQFLTETFVVVALAAVVVIVLVSAFMPWVANILNLKVTFNLADPFILATLATIVVAVTMFAGLYPAFIISRFNPIAALKSRFTSERAGGVNLRKVLVVTQFTITQILAVGTFIVISQMQFFQNVDMGFNRDSVIVTMRVFDNNPKFLQPMMNDFRQLPFTSKVCVSFTLPSGINRNRSSRNIGRPDAASLPDYHNFEFNSIDNDYLDLYGIKLLAGRPLTVSDSSGGAILINETLMKNLHISSPEKAIGEQLKYGSGNKTTVVGVVNDYYSNSLKESVDNIVISFYPEAFRFVSIQLDLKEDESMTEALAQIEHTWNKHYPDVVFNYLFFDDNIRAFYEQEFKYSRLFQMFSIIFIGIGCLGLYGLITFIANKKGKEIAVRKTLGATISNIIIMFSKEYVALIAISFALATPVVWYGVNEWLENFKNHVDVQWWMFAVPGMIVLTLALIVVASKSFNAANANPVNSLRNE